MVTRIPNNRVSALFSRKGAPSTKAPDVDFIEVARQERHPEIGTSDTRARQAVYDLFLQSKYRQASRRALRPAMLDIASTEGFDTVINAARDLVHHWRACAEEIESAFHHVRHLFPEDVLAQLTQGSLQSRTKLAREQFDRALTGATPNSAHRQYELSRAMQLCIEHFGYDASYIAAHKQVAEFRANANELESVIGELQFDDVCTHRGTVRELPRTA
jgi:hypothetical protein